MIETVREIKKRYAIDVIAGNVATAEGAQALVDAGADAVKVGHRAGVDLHDADRLRASACRRSSAIANAARGWPGPGCRSSPTAASATRGDITKALAAGAHCGDDRRAVRRAGRKPRADDPVPRAEFKTYRGMGSLGAMMAGIAATATSRAAEPATPANGKLVPEGVEGRVPYKGPLAPFVYQLVGGLRAGMGYCGCKTIEELRTKARFIQVTAASVQESHPHDIAITQEAPNYSSADYSGDAGG